MIDREEAVRIVAERCKANRWPLAEPLEIGLRKPWFGKGLPRWEIRSDVTKRGGNVVFEIDAETGTVLRQGYNPR